MRPYNKFMYWDKLNKFVFGKLPESWLVGEYKKIFIGHIKNKNVRRNASSGGIVTGAQKYLLQKKLVDGVITTKMKKDQPYLSESIIATSTDEILGGAQSKYVISPTNLILRDLPGKYNSLVYTGLPEQIASIRKLQYYKHDSVKNINYVFGLFYGELLSFSALTSFLKIHSHGIDFKKRGAFIRIANRRKKGLPVPEYGYEPVNIPASRFRIEKLLSFLFWLFKQRFFIMILENLPPKFLGWFFVLARDVWKKKTKNAKKGNLTGLRFKIKKMDNI